MEARNMVFKFKSAKKTANQSVSLGYFPSMNLARAGHCFPPNSPMYSYPHFQFPGFLFFNFDLQTLKSLQRCGFNRSILLVAASSREKNDEERQRRGEN